jgi:hypothetical protein
MVEASTTDDKDELIATATTTVDQLRQRIDALKVQLDLAKLDARDLARKQLEIAQNACLAASSKLRGSRNDLAVTADALREAVRSLIQDVQEAIDSAEAVITRG